MPTTTSAEKLTRQSLEKQIQVETLPKHGAESMQHASVEFAARKLLAESFVVVGQEGHLGCVRMPDGVTSCHFGGILVGQSPRRWYDLGSGCAM